MAYLIMDNIIKNQNGTAILITFLIMSSVLVVALGAANLIMPGILMSRTQGYSTKAYYASEAGAERALWLIRKGQVGDDYDFSDCPLSGECLDFSASPVDCDVCNNTIVNLSNGASYNVNYASSTPVTILTSSGVFQETDRSVEVRF